MAEIEFEPQITTEMWKNYEQTRAQKIVENPGYDPEEDYISDSLKAGHLPDGVAEILKKTSS